MYFLSGLNLFYKPERNQKEKPETEKGHFYAGAFCNITLGPSETLLLGWLKCFFAHLASLEFLGLFQAGFEISDILHAKITSQTIENFPFISL